MLNGRACETYACVLGMFWRVELFVCSWQLLEFGRWWMLSHAWNDMLKFNISRNCSFCNNFELYCNVNDWFEIENMNGNLNRRCMLWFWNWNKVCGCNLNIIMKWILWMLLSEWIYGNGRINEFMAMVEIWFHCGFKLKMWNWMIE